MEKSSSLIIIGRPGAERNPALLDLKKSLKGKRSYQTLKCFCYGLYGAFQAVGLVCSKALDLVTGFIPFVFEVVRVRGVKSGYRCFGFGWLRFFSYCTFFFHLIFI